MIPNPTLYLLCDVKSEKLDSSVAVVTYLGSTETANCFGARRCELGFDAENSVTHYHDARYVKQFNILYIFSARHNMLIDNNVFHMTRVGAIAYYIGEL